MKNIKHKLSIASCTLLSGASQHATANAIDNSWDLDTSFLHYSEADDRVTVNKAMAFLTGDISAEDSVNVNLVLDTMSGSTPTGAIRGGSIVASSSASGAAGTVDKQATDRANFNDTRLGVALSWAHKQDRLTTISYGGSLSVEKDYQSYGASINYAKENENRDLTYTAGFATSFDSIYRKTDGTPEPLSEVDASSIFSDGERYSYDFLVGISKALNRKTVAQLNYTLSYSDGYHSDPYKVFSRVALVEDSDTGEFAFREINRYYESRPDSRLRHAVFTSMAHQYGDTGETVHGSYRLYTDDWGITSHTIDLTHRTPLTPKSYIEPHFRYYSASAADFFLHSLIDTDLANPVDLPEYASADYRLDKSIGITIGLEYGIKAVGGNFRTRMEYINWQYDAAEYDETKAIVLQFSYQKLFY